MNSASRIVQTSSQWLMLDVDRDRPGHRAEHEPDGNRQHVDDDDVLERARVERQECQVSGRDGEEGQPERERTRQGETRRARSPTSAPPAPAARRTQSAGAP